ncbi:MAG: hypothetical protein IPH04_20430 [Saprospirales bacterium]|nr:hypothetical protein [Saprospirales bacterium]MBK6905103.1 hypothetical protein [Saprospirales bacterium]MBK7335233.1 hypothetical protein [Saprospirales bacterium]
MKWRIILPSTLLGGFLLFGCLNDTETTRLAVGEVEGFRPVYSQDWKSIQSLDPRPVGHLGKIYYKDSTIYVAESGWGIHVIDNSDPVNPQRIKFLQIPGCRDIAIKGNILYADNVTDLVAIDISDLNNIKLLKRVEGLYPEVDQTSPEAYEGYFECVDPAKGAVVAWETATLDNPQCWQ